MELQPQTLSPKQREMFARLLAEARKREEGILEPEDDFNSRLKDEFLPKLAEERGASDLIAKVIKLRKETQDAENALDKTGFSCDDDRISLRWDAPKELCQAWEEEKRSAKKERERSLKKYDLAILNVWAADSTDEAKRIVESLL